ncbi:hypothetical protein, partial [Pyruvatibacter sp.]
RAGGPMPCRSPFAIGDAVVQPVSFGRIRAGKTGSELTWQLIKYRALLRRAAKNHEFSARDLLQLRISKVNQN